MRGAPWRPSARHIGKRIRTHIPDEGDDDPQDDDGYHEAVRVQVYEEPGHDDRIRRVSEEQQMLQPRIGQKYSFYVKACDVTKYMPIPGSRARPTLSTGADWWPKTSSIHRPPTSTWRLHR